MIGAVLKLIIFTSMVNRIINTSRNENETQQVCDTYLQMFDVCTLRHTAHIEAIVQFLPYSAQQVRCDGLHSRGNSVLQIRYAHGLWRHKHFVLHVTPCDDFLWGYVKDKVFVPSQPVSIPDLKNRITAAVETITPDLLNRVSVAWSYSFISTSIYNSVHHTCKYNQLQNRSNHFDTPGTLLLILIFKKGVY